MPFPNEHSGRIRSPRQFDSDAFRRTSGGRRITFPGGSAQVPESIDIIWGKLKGAAGADDPPIAQALRFPISSWTADAARKWLNDNDVPVIEFEPATGETVDEAAHPVKRKKKKTQYQGESDHGPKNEAGMTTTETLMRVMNMGRKFSKEESEFVEKSPTAEKVCGACRFYLRNPDGSEVGLCSVVDGPIPWFSTTNLFISAVEEAKSAFEQVEGSGHEPEA